MGNKSAERRGKGRRREELRIEVRKAVRKGEEECRGDEQKVEERR